MNTLLRRLKYFSFGFIPGLIIVIFFFGARGCSWLPANRVKGSVIDRVVVVSEKNQQAIEKLGLNSTNLAQFITDAKVNFDKSSTKSNPKIYHFSKDGKSVYFALPKDSYIAEIVKASKDVMQVNLSSDGFGELILFPKEQDLVYVDTNKRLTCQQGALGMIQNKQFFDAIKKNGKLDFSKSRLLSNPKTHYLVFKNQQGIEIGANTLWYKDRIDIIRLDLEKALDCN
jgi:hypothetical protein